ncbi:glycosyltransferase family 4 protein [soil metagenome]
MVLVKSIPTRAKSTKKSAKQSPSATDKAAPKDTGFRVAIVHDWLIGGGAELVVEQLHKMFPSAPIYTSYCTPEWRARLDNKVVTGWLQHWPFSRLRKFIPLLRIRWFTRLNLEAYDLVISSSGAEAKGIRVKKPLHINYCHAPTHYYWSRYDEYLKQPGFGIFDGLARLGLRLLVGPLRKWDYKAAQRPDHIIANSRHIQAEIKKYYGRESVIIHPPVYLERFQKAANRNRARSGFVISGRQTPYKRFDLAVVACTKLNLPLTVIGSGPDQRRLRRLAGPNVTFLGRASDEVIEEEFAQAVALIFPGLDDFGITPVEAMASGTPVIAYGAGGALDYIKPGVTGELFAEQSLTSLAKTLHTFKPENYNSKDCRLMAQTFSTDKFARHLQTHLKTLLKASARR